MVKISKEIRDLHINVKFNIDKDHDPTRIVNFTQYQIVKYLLVHKNEEVCQKDLEIETKLNKASITGSIDSLEEKGIVKRIQSEADKRKNIIVVTEKTKGFIKEYETVIEELDKKIINNVSEEDLKTFIKVVNIMNHNLTKEK